MIDPTVMQCTCNLPEGEKLSDYQLVGNAVIAEWHETLVQCREVLLLEDK